MQWNGRAWTERRLPHRAHVLYKVDAANARDVWTVGVRRLDIPGTSSFWGSGTVSTAGLRLTAVIERTS
ncbi:hypothetical protein [Micromonospora tulbaghiae]|uniref:hypothetical protein n=1 Tax=Micromonospora tulbaghiae TaxID=479978 RepID=UPI0033D8E564